MKHISKVTYYGKNESDTLDLVKPITIFLGLKLWLKIVDLL